ncbi:MAG: YraN family protein [Christensenellaceae bacterium]|nr:YraN family protein [Christensenellaceae bacterium]
MSTLNLRNGSKTQRDGLRGERIALWYLRFHGYRLLERNYRIGHKEIDLIVRKGNTVAFVEVKARRSFDGIRPMASVDYRKRKNIIAASRYYIAASRLSRVVFRYDIIEVNLKSLQVTHIINAYYAGI